MSIRLETRSLDGLTAYARNSKPHPQSQIDSIKASIQRFGFRDPIGVTEDGVIVEGHGRVLAATQLGLTEVPAIILPATMTADQIDLYRIAHNKLALTSTFDFAVLVEQLRDIVMDTAEFADMGFAPDAVASLFEMFSQSVPSTSNSNGGSGEVEDEAGLEFEIVWEDNAAKERFKAFVANAQTRYGGTPGKALSEMMADIVAGKLIATHIQEEPATAATVGGMEWMA